MLGTERLTMRRSFSLCVIVCPSRMRVSSSSDFNGRKVEKLASCSECDTCILQSFHASILQSFHGIAGVAEELEDTLFTGQMTGTDDEEGGSLSHDGWHLS